MVRQCKNVCLIIFILFLVSTLTAQDSLYLVGTITGESYQKRITNISRVGDVNGDGYDDFMLSSRTGKTRSDQGIVQLYLGSATLDLVPDMTFHYPGNDILNDGIDAYEIGDINNDGYDDFAISGFFGDYGGFPKGKVFLYYGGETIDTIPFAEFYEPWVQDYFGSVVEKVGDLNKDGYGDFTISSQYNWTNGLGYVYLFWGGDTISWDKSLTFKSDSLGDFFGESVANIGDINMDGFEDIGVGIPNEFSGIEPGKVCIYYGGKTMNGEPDTILSLNIINIQFGRIIKRGGDINNDSITDFLIGSWGGVFLYVSFDSLIILNGSIGIGADGDLNNDGFSDFVIGDAEFHKENNTINGIAYVYLGKETVDTNYAFKIEGEIGSSFVSTIFFADINGDGYDELFIIAPNYPDYNSPNGKIYIYSYKNLTSIEDRKNNSPDNFRLNQNYPNPFNPITTISWQSPVFSHTTIKVFDILGKEVATLVNEEKLAGKHKVEFDASKYNLSSGIYFCELRAKAGISEYIKLVFMK
ncbi:MAG: FG-GAP-like repeat-containing protein [Ignavibacteriaceae bacterium]|jgi:hypothetical protein|nr:FG-GAP-like repeat-containing protein [Ignavibacteriaceae bacterium]